MINQEQIEHVLELLNDLNPSYRAVLILRGLHDLSGKEAANVLGWTQSKVNVTYHRAIHAARACLEMKGVHIDEERRTGGH